MPRPEQVSALQARLALQDKRFDAALQAFASMPLRLEPALAADVRGCGMQAELGLFNAGQAAKAQPWFERQMRESPGHAAGSHGLARVRGELGEWAESLRLHEVAAVLKDAADWPIV